MAGSTGSIARDVIDERWCVSTVHLMIDHGFRDSAPLWYETMIFACDAKGKVTDWGDRYCRRYTTEEQAREGHSVAIRWLGEHPDAIEDDE